MPKTGDQLTLERLVDEVLASSKYKGITTDLIRKIGVQELEKRRNFKEALKATKNKLHQVGGAYLEGRDDYAGWLKEIQIAQGQGETTALKQVCQQIMSRHASTRERLPILETFYTTLFAAMVPVRSVLDIACGLHPLAIPWMPLPTDVQYYACDIYQQMMDFLNGYMKIIGVAGAATSCDVTQNWPEQAVDVAFVLKVLPCLEQIEKGAGRRLLQGLRARYVVVSFPVQSLGGRGKGMAEYYTAYFLDVVGSEAWSVKKFDFVTELVFVVNKEGSGRKEGHSAEV